MNNLNKIIGVGGFIVRDNSLLLVKQSYGDFKGMWMLPGGHIEPKEHLAEAVIREVREETDISAVPDGIIAVRSKIIDESTTDVYMILKMHESSELNEAPVCDGDEITEATFIPFADVLNDHNVVGLVRGILKEYVDGNSVLIEQLKYRLPDSDHIDYQVYV